MGLTEAAAAGSAGGMWEALNLDALLETVEGDLAKFLLQQHAVLLGPAAGAGAGGSKSVGAALGAALNDEAWDPRVHFMVSFVKDCARVSVRARRSRPPAPTRHTHRSSLF